MMRPMMVAVALLTTAVATPAVAQADWSISVLGGFSRPLGEFDDALDLGYHGGLMVGMRSASGKFGASIESQFHWHSKTWGFGDGSTAPEYRIEHNSYGIMGRIEVAVVGPAYLLGGVGVYRTRWPGSTSLLDESRNSFARQVGAGITFGPGMFIEARHLEIVDASGFPNDGISMIPISLGIRF